MPRVIQNMRHDARGFILPSEKEKEKYSTLQHGTIFAFPNKDLSVSFQAVLLRLNENTMSLRLLKSIKCQGFPFCRQLPSDKNAFQKNLYSLWDFFFLP